MYIYVNEKEHHDFKHVSFFSYIDSQFWQDTITNVHASHQAKGKIQVHKRRKLSEKVDRKNSQISAELIRIVSGQIRANTVNQTGFESLIT